LSKIELAALTPLRYSRRKRIPEAGGHNPSLRILHKTTCLFGKNNAAITQKHVVVHNKTRMCTN